MMMVIMVIMVIMAMAMMVIKISKDQQQVTAIRRSVRVGFVSSVGCVSVDV